MSVRVPVVHEEESGGLPVFYVEAPAPATAALCFRVGQWDEAVLNRGIAHMVEHLALYPLRKVEVQHNASVHGDFTAFWAVGSEERMQELLAGVCRNLRALPLDRLEAETQVLKAEAAGQPGNYAETLLTILFGPNGPGMLAYPERGLDLVGPEEVQAWADQWFTRDNAVLLLSGPRRPRIDVDLPAGERRPFRIPDAGLGYRPQRTESVGEQDRGLCLGSLVRRTTATALAWEVFTERLTDRLRHDLGLVYNVASMYLPLDADTAFVYAGADGAEGRVDETATAFMDVLHELKKDGPDGDGLERLKKRAEVTEDTDAAAFARNELQRVGMNRLLGHPEEAWEALMAERAAAAPEEVRGAFEAAAGGAAVIAPSASRLSLPERVKRAFEPVQGKRFRSRTPRIPGSIDRLVLGDEGCSGWADQRWVTLLWRDLVMAERLDDGRWSLLDRNGSWMTLDPATWWWRRKVARLLDAHIPAGVRTPQPRRP